MWQLNQVPLCIIERTAIAVAAQLASLAVALSGAQFVEAAVRSGRLPASAAAQSGRPAAAQSGRPLVAAHTRWVAAPSASPAGRQEAAWPWSAKVHTPGGVLRTLAATPQRALESDQGQLAPPRLLVEFSLLFSSLVSCPSCKLGWLQGRYSKGVQGQQGAAMPTKEYSRSHPTCLI